MAGFIRLRQICLAAPELEPAVQAVQAIFGLEVCHRDEAVAKYGLVNALFVLGHAFLEIVAPTREGTTAGRFIERGAPAQGGYMAIFDCADPLPQRQRAQAMGVRIAHTMDYPAFFGTQLHPRDCRATMLEFDRSAGNESLDAAYWPAGTHWQAQQRLDLVSGLPCIEVRTPDVDGLAAHWSRLIGVPVQRDADGTTTLNFDLGAVRFVSAPAGTAEQMTVLDVAVPNPQMTLAAAAKHGCTVEGDRFRFCGVALRPV